MSSPTGAPLRIERRDAGTEGVVLLAVSGDLILTACDTLREAVEVALDEGPDRVVLDLARATHVDMSGFALLVHLHDASREADSELVVASLPLKFRETSDSLRLPDYLRMTDDVEAATGPGA